MSLIFFFFLMIRRPPRSPLFPSTTLSRSHHEPRLQRSPRPYPRPPPDHGCALAACDRRHGARSGQAGRPPARRDRKSTRLNSSHSQISYAVFCLKKKKLVDPPPLICILTV